MKYILSGGSLTNKSVDYIRDTIEINFACNRSSIPSLLDYGFSKILTGLDLSDTRDILVQRIYSLLNDYNKRNKTNVELKVLDVTESKIYVELDINGNIDAYEIDR